MFIDTHCHIDTEKELLDIMEQMKGKNIDKLIISGVDAESNRMVVDLASKYENIYATVGFHPSHFDETCFYNLEELEKQALNNKVVAIGEIGLDYYWKDNNKDFQKKIFKDQLALAKKLKKPVVIHNRDATNDIYELLKGEELKGVIHCFSEDVSAAKKFIDIGFLLGIGGIVTFKKNNQLEKVLNEIYLEYIVLETDSPYLTPEPFRGKKNSPLNIIYIAQKLALIKGITKNSVGEITTANARRLFDL